VVEQEATLGWEDVLKGILGKARKEVKEGVHKGEGTVPVGLCLQRRYHRCFSKD
jgi:hypothetical protein